MKVENKYLESKSLESLEIKMDEMSDDGWEASGSVTVDEHAYIQRMVRMTPEIKIEKTVLMEEPLSQDLSELSIG